MRFSKFFILLVLSFTQSILPQNSKIIGRTPGYIDFQFLNGEKPSWDDFKDQVVLIDFWATWCPPCIESIPHMNELVDKFKSKPVRFISITYEPKALVEKFIQKYPMKSEPATDNDFATFRTLNAWSIPNIFMVNKEGKIVGRIHPDYLTENVINEILNGKIPDVEQTPEDQFEPEGAENYFRSLLDKQMKKYGVTSSN